MVDVRKRVHIDSMIPQLLRYLASFEKGVAEGTVDEKRRFLRAFIRRVALDPKTGTGRAEIYDLPVFSVQEKKANRSGRPCFHRDNRECGQPSSFQMVAGVGFEPTTSGL